MQFYAWDVGLDRNSRIYEKEGLEHTARTKNELSESKSALCPTMIAVLRSSVYCRYCAWAPEPT